MTDLVLLKVAKPKRWAVAKPTRKFYRHRKAACRSKGPVPGRGSQDRRSVGLIAVAHEREASQRWDTQLGQGDPLNQVSVHVPAGRGPFRSGEDGALDALVNCAPFAARNKDWLVRGLLTILGLVLIAVPVRAHDHNQPGLKPWFERLRSRGNTPCCDGSDATRLDDIDWDSKDGNYRVRLNGRWVDVPEWAVVDGPNRAGPAMVWPFFEMGVPTGVRCFMPGSMT